MNVDFQQWEEKIFFPAFIGKVDAVFTWIEWNETRTEWQSKSTIDGKADGKAHIVKKSPFFIKDWKSGETMQIFKAYAMHEGCGYIEAKARMASIVGVPFPDKALVEKMRAEAEHEAKIEEAIQAAANALLFDTSAECERVRVYLQAHRKYSGKLASLMRLGVLTSEVKKMLEGVGILCGLKQGVYADHLLLIPTYNFGHLAGITIRSIDAHCEENGGHKYAQLKTITRDGEKVAYNGLKGLETSTPSDLVLVEGELDALHIKALNSRQIDEDAIVNVAALSTHSINDTQYKQIKKMASKRDAKGLYTLQSITILYDGGEDLQGIAKEGTINAIEQATSGRVKVYVADLQAKDGEKVDADSYLNTHTLADLKSIIDAASSADMWKWERVIKRYTKLAEGGTLTDKQGDAMGRELAEIYGASKHPIEKHRMAQEWEESGRSIAYLEGIANDMQKAMEQMQTREAVLLSIEEAMKDIKASVDVSASIDKMLANIQAVKQEANASEVEDILHIPSKDEVLNEWKMMREGIPMPYVFKLGRNTDECQQFQIPSAALTYVAAPTSNGKSCMLQNMALYTAAQCGKDESILYFVFEESKRDTIMEMLAIYSGKAYSNRNKSTIKSYLRNGETKFFKDKSRGPWHLQKAMDAFLGKYITSGKIRIYDKDTDATHLVDIMMKAAQQTKVKAIFIDYMQKMHDTNIASKAFGRDQELCGICDALNTFCNESGLPVVLAAQISRTGSKSPMEMSCNTIADASSIEKAAHAIILLYQNKGHYTGASKEWQPSTFVNRLKAKGIAPEAETEKMESIFPEDGRNKIWMRIDKYRGEESGGEMVFEFYGASGRIKPNIQQFAGIEGIEEDSIPKDVMFDTAEAGNGDLFEDTDKETNEDIIAF